MIRDSPLIRFDNSLQEIEQILLREREQHSMAIQQLNSHAESEINRLKSVISQLQNETRVQASHFEEQLVTETTKNKAEQTSLKQSFVKQNQEAKERISYLEQTLEAQTKENGLKCEQSEQRIR